MTPLLVFVIVLTYFLILMGIGYLTSSKADNETFFTANRQSPWPLVAFGMVGATLSGVTFISVPGEVGNTAWTYLQFVFGNMIGYVVIALILIPLFYKMKLISIYEYLKDRFGHSAYITGASFFLLSQTIGASFRLFLAALVLQVAFFDSFGISFYVTVLVTVLLIWLYTYRGGIKTIVWTDTLQTSFLLIAVILSIGIIIMDLNLAPQDLYELFTESRNTRILDWTWDSERNFFKTFLAGVFITIAMNGLDQNVMQKNLTCKTPRDAQKNIFWFSIAFFFATLLFLSLGVLLYEYAAEKGISIPERSDSLYPILAFDHFGLLAGISFLVGIIAAAFSSADSALTALTTSFCIDILDLPAKKRNQQRIRLSVHIGFSILMFIVIMLFSEINDSSVVTAVFKVAGFTYGPLLGLYAFGLFTKLEVRQKWIPYVCIIAPILCVVLDLNSESWLNGYKFGFEILIVNALLTCLGLLFASRNQTFPQTHEK